MVFGFFYDNVIAIRCIQFYKLVCSSQSNKAFELAAAYLQTTKGTKETNNEYHKWYSVEQIVRKQWLIDERAYGETTIKYEMSRIISAKTEEY